MAKLLYIGTRGTDDPTQASIAFVNAKGAVEAKHEAGIMLIGEAATLVKDNIVKEIHGVGFPPLKEVMEFLVGNKVPISV